LINTEDSNSSSKAEENISVDYEGDEIFIGFNSTKIIELLKNIDTEVVELSISTGKKPVIIKPFESTDNYNVLTLLMPASVDNS
jgi:DNA polymerase III sliding clamp (beta) subunit (PCNA family)